jgi:hypothetical protein
VQLARSSGSGEFSEGVNFMSSNISKFFRWIGPSTGALTGIALAAAILSSPAKADEYDKKTLLTVDQPTQVYNTYLAPGTYMFRLLDWDRHIVELATPDRSRVINIILAIPAYRVFPTSKAEFTFWETPPGTPRAVRKWFYPGDTNGWEFQYPTKWQQVAAVAPAPAPPPAISESTVKPPAPSAAQNESETAQAVEQAPPPQPAPQEQSVQEQSNVEIAQNTPPANTPPIAQNNPPAPETPAPAPAQNLPQTASPYPLVALAGLLALVLGGVLRFTRTVGQNS